MNHHPNQRSADALHALHVPDALVSMRTAARAADMGVATLYRKSKTDPKFPKLIKIGSRCTRIRAGDLTTWLASLAQTAQ